MFQIKLKKKKKTSSFFFFFNVSLLLRRLSQSRRIEMQILLKKWCSVCRRVRAAGVELQERIGSTAISWESRTMQENVKKTNKKNVTNLKVLSVLLSRKTYASRAVAFISVLDCAWRSMAAVLSFFLFFETVIWDQPFLQCCLSSEEPISGRDTEEESMEVELQGKTQSKMKVNIRTNSQIKLFILICRAFNLIFSLHS